MGVLVDDDNSLHMYVNGIDQGVAIRDVPMPCYGLVDVYGQCERVSIRIVLMYSYAENIHMG